MTAGLVVLLLAPFACALLALLAGARAARATLAAAPLLAVGLLLAGHGTPVGVTGTWVPALGLGVSFVGDSLGLCAAAVCLALGVLGAGRVGVERTRAALAFAATGLAQALVLGASLAPLGGAAALAALAGFGLERHGQGAALDAAGWVLLLRVGAALALLAAALLVADALGGGELAALAAATPAERAQPLFAPTLALAGLGALGLAGAWPWRRWLWREPRGAAFADPLLALAAVVLVLRLASLAPLAPRVLAAAALAVVPLAAALAGRLLGATHAPGAGPAA